MTTLPKWAYAPLAVLAALLVLWLGKSCYDGHVRSDALAAQRADSLAAALRAQSHRKDSIAVVYRHDTVTLTQRLTSYRTLRDTLWLSDTVMLTVRESVFVAKADSAISQCVATIRTCEALQAEKDTIIATQRAQLRAEIARRPGFFRRVGESLKWVAIGAAAGALVRR